MLQSTDTAAIPLDIDILYRYGNNSPIQLHVSNITTGIIVASQNAILCEVQPVSNTDIEIDNDVAHGVLDEVTLTSDLLTEEQHELDNKLFQQLRDVLAHQIQIMDI